MEKSWLFKNMRLVAKQQILLPIISMKMSLIISESKTGLLSLLDYAIWDIMKKILYKNLKWYENIQGPSAAMSYVWDRVTKKFVNNFNRPMANAIRISGGRRRWSLCTSNLTTPTHDSTYFSIVIDILFINRNLNMKKWL